MRNRLVILACGLAVLGSANASASRRQTARPLEGYVCKMLNLTEEQALSPQPQVFVKAEPAASAPNIGWAPLTVAVKEPEERQNGFVEMINLGGKTVWIPEAAIVSWQSRSNPAARCTPSVMSNGRLGFTYSN